MDQFDLEGGVEGLGDAVVEGQNGKVERLNRTLQTEWAYRQPFTGNTARAEALDPWLQHYNTRRYHRSIGGPPISRLSRT